MVQNKLIFMRLSSGIFPNLYIEQKTQEKPSPVKYCCKEFLKVGGRFFYEGNGLRLLANFCIETLFVINAPPKHPVTAYLQGCYA